MSEFEIIRMTIAVGMISVATYCDVKTRYVDDRIWIIAAGFFGITSLVFIFLLGTAAQELISPINIIGTSSGVGIAFTGWIMKFRGMGYATGDFFGLLSLSVILPSFDGIIVPVPVIMFSCILSIMISIANNLRINIKSKSFFTEFDEPTYKKILAYFIIHKKKKNENFAFPAENIINGKRKFQFRHEPDTQEFVAEEGIYVCSTLPMMISILVGLGIVITAILIL